MNVSEYNKCVDEHADAVYRFILKNTRDKEKARDIVQDTFEKLWLRAGDIEAAKSRSYLFTSAYHTMIDYIRREKFTGDFESVKEEHHTVSHPFTDLKKILDTALSRLSEIQRSVILLRDYEGYSYSEIGEITGLNESQVKVYIYRARLELKNYLGSMEQII